MRILVVEDEPRMARLLRRALTEEGYAADIAPDGVAGLDAATGGGYDAIVLDVMLPKLDGFTVCRTLRAQGDDVPILMLTARGQVRDRVAGLDGGADDYLTKPFHLAEFFARLRALLRPRHPQPPAPRGGGVAGPPGPKLPLRPPRGGLAVCDEGGSVPEL
ncbi:response regulator transcription factor, partial [Nocardia neocaledoniensis]|uniref:response regulator transcription factor n=1 Tax=Nocardia neocaledoniensis TaxID=236511 RepID=UPI002458315C